MKKITSLVIGLILLCVSANVTVAADEPVSLIKNGDFSAKTDWSGTGVLTGEYLDMSAAGAYEDTFVQNLEAGAEYKIEFQMQSGIADALQVVGNETSTSIMFYQYYLGGNVKAINRDAWKFGEAAASDDEIHIWKDYSFSVVVPPTATVMRLRLANKGNDTNMKIDNVKMFKVEGPANYLKNGDFENGLKNWNAIGAPGAVAGDAQNHYFNRTSETKGNYIRQILYMPAGRYKLSLKAKTENKGDKVRVNLCGSDGSGSYGTSSAGWFYDYIAGKTATSNASFSDDWGSFSFYFTIPTDETTIYVALPAAYWAADSGVGKAQYDDVVISRDETWIDFATYTKENVTDHSYAEVKAGESLSALPASGGKIPVTAHFVPGTDGEAMPVTMISAIYKIESDGTKQLVDVSVKSGTTDVSEATKGGKNSMGTLTLSDSLTCPAGSDVTYTAEVMLWDSFANLKAYTAKTILTK